MKQNTARSAGLKWTVIIMVSKYIRYFLNENNLELGEEFMLADENGRVFKIIPKVEGDEK